MKKCWIRRLLAMVLIMIIGASLPINEAIASSAWGIDVKNASMVSVLDREDFVFRGIVGHTLYAETLPFNASGIVPPVKWEVSSKKAASIIAQTNSMAIIKCKKAGVTGIKARSVYFKDEWRGALLVIRENRSDYYFNYDDIDYSKDYNTQGKSVYIKNGKLYVDAYVYNNWSFPIKRLSPQKVFLTLNWETMEYIDFGTYPAKLKKKVNPGKVGVASVMLGPVEDWKYDFTMADAYLEGYCYSKNNSISRNNKNAKGDRKPKRIKFTTPSDAHRTPE